MIDGHDDPEFCHILREIDAVDGCPRTKARVKAILRRRAGQRVRFSERAFSHPERVHAATMMLDAKRTRPEIRDALCFRYQVSEATAYRIIDEALSWRLHRGRTDGS